MEEAANLTGELYDELDQRDSIERATGKLEKITSAVDMFGYKLEANTGKWAQYGLSLSKAFAPIDAALSAQEALSDGQRTVADAQEKYQDIVNGNTDGLKSAAKAMTEARDDLAKAVAETGPGSKAARDAAGDVRDALRAYRDLQVEIGKGPAEGDFFDPRTQDLQDQYERIIEAQQKLNDINAGNSDQVVSARERLTDAQEKYNEELAKTGPNSKEAADALEAVTDAERELPGLVVSVEAAQANLREEINKHPEAIQASIEKIDEWVRKGLISTAVAKAWKEELILAAAASQNLNMGAAGSEYVGDDGTDREHHARRPVSRSSKPTPGAPKEILSIEKGKEIGLSDRDPIFDTQNKRYYSYDEKEREWVLDQSAGTWTRYSTGGVVPGFTLGDTHKALLTPGEGVLSKPAMQQLGTQNFEALNRGQAVIGGAVDELLSQLVGGQEQLRNDVVSLLRAMVQSPDAGVAWLQAIEANTRQPRYSPTPDEMRAKVLGSLV